MEKNNGHKFKIILVNSITLLRLIGFFMLPFIYFHYDAGVCSIVTLCLFLTDFIDGFLARKLHASTLIGAFLDALCDKLLNIMSIVLIGITYDSMLFPLIVEISILYTSYATYRYGGNVKTIPIGKVKTFVLNVCVIVCFIFMAINKLNTSNKIILYLIHHTEGFINFFSSVTSVFCLITLLFYIKKYRETREDKNAIKIMKTKKKFKSKEELKKIAFDTKYYLKHKDESIMAQIYV